MRKAFILVIALIYVYANVGCKKSSGDTEQTTDLLIESAREFMQEKSIPPHMLLDSSYRTSHYPGNYLTKNILWEKATVVNFWKDKAVLIPIQYSAPFFVGNSFSGKNIYQADDLIELLVYKDDQKVFHTELITFLPDTNYSAHSKKFSGVITVNAWNNDFIAEFLVQKGRTIKRYLPESKVKTVLTLSPTTKMAPSSITICYESYGYNYIAEDPSTGYPWTQSLGCITYFFDIAEQNEGIPGGGNYTSLFGGSSGGVAPEKTFEIASGRNRISNIKDYVRCFSNSPGNGNAYSVSLCVEQPETGTRQTWGFSGTGSSASSNPISVGHTFLILSQSNSMGSTTRNIGFYPTSAVNPVSPVSTGELNNDASHDYNISVTITMNSSQFFQVLGFLSQIPEDGYLYNLNSNNCTTFALNALAAAGVNLPRTTGTWLNGRGLNPGDLGEDLHNMQLPSNITRTTLSGTHPNTGFCLD